MGSAAPQPYSHLSHWIGAGSRNQRPVRRIRQTQCFVRKSWNRIRPAAKIEETDRAIKISSGKGAGTVRRKAECPDSLIAGTAMACKLGMQNLLTQIPNPDTAVS